MMPLYLGRVYQLFPPQPDGGQCIPRRRSPEDASVWRRNRSLWEDLLLGYSFVGMVLSIALAHSCINYDCPWRLPMIIFGAISGISHATLFIRCCFALFRDFFNSPILPVTIPVNDAIALQNITSELGRPKSEQSINLAPALERENLRQPMPSCLVVAVSPEDEKTFFGSPAESKIDLLGGPTPDTAPEQKGEKLPSHSEVEPILQRSAAGETLASAKALEVASAISQIAKDTIEEKHQTQDVETSTDKTSSDNTPDKDESKGEVRQRKISPKASPPETPVPKDGIKKE